MPKVVKPQAMPASNFAQGVAAAGAHATYNSGYVQASGTSLWPYSANVIWQDTTSNATYCSASAALGSTA